LGGGGKKLKPEEKRGKRPPGGRGFFVWGKNNGGLSTNKEKPTDFWGTGGESAREPSGTGLDRGGE